jgi:uncharacterized BrkB/YihY/UPF0761 family membrane protein
VAPDDFNALVTNTVTLLLTLMAIASVISGAYIVWIYRRRGEEAPFLTRLVVRDVRVAIAAFVIAVYIIVSLSGYGFPRPWGAVVVGGAVAAMLFGVIDDAWTWYWQRRRFGR